MERYRDRREGEDPQLYADLRGEQLRRMMRERIMTDRTAARNYSYLDCVVGLGALAFDGAMIYNNPRILEDKYTFGAAVVMGAVGAGLLYFSRKKHKEKKALDVELSELEEKLRR